MKDFSYITNSHPSFVENLYKEYVNNPQSVDPELKKFFEGFDFAISTLNGSVSAKPAQAPASAVSGAVDLSKEFAVYQLIHAYRKRAHLVAKTNPIRPRKDRKANLDLSAFGLSEADMQTSFQSGKFIGMPGASLKDILNRLQQVYASTVGVEYTYVNDNERCEWLEQAVEERLWQPVPLDQKKRILEKLNQGVIFEKFLHTKYIGQKRFSLEGGETAIPALDAIINTAANHDVQEVVIGMAHRGRLNVLANVLGKTYEQIFTEFEGVSVDTTMGSGDVKYHLGFGSEVETWGGKKIYLKLSPNPSHLEAVDPVVLGFARAKADVIYNKDYDKVLPILIHGDASIAGQGVVYEIVQMSYLRGYHTGGTIHLVINNQIGFTTDFDDARSADYCTSIAAMIQAPVLHVNGDDAEAMVRAVQIATEYRQKFNSDIFIDMLCYRRHGHNEGDDPKYTQPKMYGIIEKHQNPREKYTQFLIDNGEPDARELAKDMEKKFWNDLQERLDDIKQNPLPYKYQQPEEWWRSLRKATAQDFDRSPVTAISADEVNRLFRHIMQWPEGFQPLRKVEKLLQDKVKLFESEQKIDWATGELLAYASIISEGNVVRMSGQDVKRGTFSHRHAVIYDENTNKGYNRIKGLGPDGKGKMLIYNSLLSEYAVLGFEYGYSMANPHALVLWEAQFGDFANGAQTIIDQFIVAGEQKWNRMNGVTMLLPHGYEGQGPEHSSGRMERFLQMCAELNIVVANITTSANLFHALRRQLAWPFRKPLVVFTPKANLRYAGTYSHVNEFSEGGFREVIDDPTTQDAAAVTKVLFCSGKIYFELAERKQKENKNDVAIIRLEQLYPLPEKQLADLYKKYSRATWFWVQEEPLNMGAAGYLQMHLKNINYGVISRHLSAATATGYSKVHAQEQKEIIDTAFGI